MPGDGNTARCGQLGCMQPVTRIDGVVEHRGRVFYATPCGHVMAADDAMAAYQAGHPPVHLQAVTAVALVAAERRRQITQEGHTPEADAALPANDLAWAAWCYVDAAAYLGDQWAARLGEVATPPQMWPGLPSAWKAGPTRVRMLVKAAALICAAIDVLLAKGEQP